MSGMDDDDKDVIYVCPQCGDDANLAFEVMTRHTISMDMGVPLLHPDILEFGDMVEAGHDTVICASCGQTASLSDCEVEE